jgi:hypothetical protein
MLLVADQGAVYADLGDVWLRDQTARILHRYFLFGRHCRLDLNALLSHAARRQRAPMAVSPVSGRRGR